jgi:hypothetical protein
VGGADQTERWNGAGCGTGATTVAVADAQTYPIVRANNPPVIAGER